MIQWMMNYPGYGTIITIVICVTIYSCVDRICDAFTPYLPEKEDTSDMDGKDE